MSKSAMLTAMLALVLVVSNGWWLLFSVQHVPDSRSNSEQCGPALDSLQLADRAIVQSFAAIQAAAATGASQASVVAAAREANRANQHLCFNDPGVVDVGAIGLQFNDAGRLIGATRGFCPP